MVGSELLGCGLGTRASLLDNARLFSTVVKLTYTSLTMDEKSRIFKSKRNLDLIQGSRKLLSSQSLEWLMQYWKPTLYSSHGRQEAFWRIERMWKEH